MADVFRSSDREIAKKDSLSTAIQSLDSLNDQIVQFIFTPKSAECDVSGGGGGDSLKPLERDSLKSNLALMRRLLVDAQAKFHRMMDDNKKLAAKIDNSLQNSNQGIDDSRENFSDTNKRLSQMSTDSSPVTPDNDQDNKEWQKQQDQHELEKLREKVSRLELENKSLMKKVDDAHILGQGTTDDVQTVNQLKIQLTQTEHELARAKEALTAMKADRKRLKSEKVDLLNQMKQLYCTLEAKEEEMRAFIRNYEQRMTESEASLKKIVAEKEEVEKDRWEILKRAREAAERSVALREQLDKKDKENEYMEEEINKLKRQLMAERQQAPRIMLSTSSSVNDSMILGSHCHDGSMGSDSALSAGPECPDASTPGSDLPETPPMSSRGIRTTHSFISDNTSADSESREFLLSPAEHLSRSSEELCNVETASTTSKERFKKKKQKKFNSLSKIFSKKNRATLEQIVFDDTNLSSSRHSSTLELFSLDEQEKTRLAEKCKTVPMGQWKANMVVAWLEQTMCLPQYSKGCAENIKSGKVLLGLSDSELESGMGITNVLHRRKLRLAIDQHKVPSECKFPKAAELDHCWVARAWLADLGLSQYSLTFESERVDGPVLNSLTKRDLEKYLKVTRKFHQASLLHGIELLRMLKFNKTVLTERRSQCEAIDMDPLVWSTQRVIKWARSIDLNEYSENLLDSGVHGALMVLEPSFDSDAMATALGIPSSKNIIRRHLTTELNALVLPARSALQTMSTTNDARNRRASAGTLGSGSSFQRSYYSSGENGNRKPTFRGSLGRALGRKLRQEMQHNHNSSFGAMPEQIRSKSRSQELGQESTLV